MKANSEKTKQSNKATRRVLAGVLCGASVLSLVLSLVMPPISQAIANDAQAVSAEKTVMGGGSSSESTDVDNTTGRDAENQDNDDAEGDDEIQQEEQPKDESQAEENEAIDDAAGSSAEEAVASEEVATDIKNADDLQKKLLGVEENQTASFTLAADIDYADEITLGHSNSKITLDLKGHKITHTGNNSNKPLFSVCNGAEFTITDTEPVEDKITKTQPLKGQGQELVTDNYGKTEKMLYEKDVPTKLTYYVTKSSVDTTDSTRTNEITDKHEVTINGAIVGTQADSTMRLINVYAGGTFNLQKGVLTTTQNAKVGSLIYAENGSTVNMSGGYVCGATSNSRGAGIELGVKEGNGATLNLTNGVIAGNCAGSGGGVYASGVGVPANDPNKTMTKINMTGGVISGNSTLASGAGLGGGIMAEGGIVTVSGGYITNNRMAKFCGHDGWGCHGGAGLAANNGAHVAISGGQITGNYSEEAGGGVYVTDVNRNNQSRTGMARLNITGGIIASNVSYRSEGAGIRVGQMVDAMINGSSNDSPVYITNNHCMSRFDWGGGGIFVQGNSNEGMEKTAGRLFVYNSYISSNTAGGYGGGVAVCPTGKTLVTNTKGTAIFGNKSAGSEQEATEYNSAENKGNDGTPHLSAGGADGFDKTEDQDAYGSKVFRERGHADFFLVAKAGHTDPIAAVIGKMLGGGDAKYSGSKERSENKEPSENKELYEAIDIPANGGVKIYRSVGLTSGVQVGSEEANNAQNAATTFITGNYSWDHGGGIMSNGDLYLGVPADTYVYPSLKLKATKALKMKNKQTEESIALAKDQFSFSVYRKDSDGAKEPSWNDKTFNSGGCTLVGTAKNDADGNITFDLGEQFIDKTVEANKITYYLVENAGNDLDITYDPAVYKIVVTVQDNQTLLMKVPSRENPNSDVPLYVHNYTIKSVSPRDSTNSLEKDDQGYYSINGPDGEKTFTNKYTPYTSTGTWTPKVTKVVKGGEMKEFTLEFADNADFKNAKTVVTNPKGEIITTADGGKSQTLGFGEIKYNLASLKQSDSDVPVRGASKTFTYYMCEKNDSSIFSHYKFDNSVYKFTVVATDDTNGNISCKVTYGKGTVDSDGKWAGDDTTDHDLTDDSTPTFTNTYSTSLPLSGMSGVTLTYLAGAAVLCAAAAWMHVRRKANAKGGERRE